MARHPHRLCEQQPFHGAHLHGPTAERLQHPGQVAGVRDECPRSFISLPVKLRSLFLWVSGVCGN